MARDIGAPMMFAEWLFVETVSDVRRRSEDPGSRSRYELLGIAPLLRRLLLDGSALVDTVRTARREVPIEFRINPWSAPDERGDDLPYAMRLACSKLIGSPDGLALSSVEDFTSRVGLVDAADLTVRQVVRYYTHVEGGVHFGIPEDGQQTIDEMAHPGEPPHTDQDFERVIAVGPSPRLPLYRFGRTFAFPGRGRCPAGVGPGPPSHGDQLVRNQPLGLPSTTSRNRLRTSS